MNEVRYNCAGTQNNTQMNRINYEVAAPLPVNAYTMNVNNDYDVINLNSHADLAYRQTQYCWVIARFPK